MHSDPANSRAPTNTTASPPGENYDEAHLKQLEDDDPGITWVQTVRATLPLVDGVAGKLRAVGVILLRVLP